MSGPGFGPLNAEAVRLRLAGAPSSSGCDSASPVTHDWGQPPPAIGLGSARGKRLVARSASRDPAYGTFKASWASAYQVPSRLVNGSQ